MRPGRMGMDLCTHEPSWLQCLAERLCFMPACCQTLGRKIFCSPILSIWLLGKAGQEAEQVPTPPSCTPVLTAVPVCKAGRAYISWLHVNIA